MCEIQISSAEKYGRTVVTDLTVVESFQSPNNGNRFPLSLIHGISKNKQIHVSEYVILRFV